MKNSIQAFFNKISYHLKRGIHERFLFKISSKEAVFTGIYKSNYWENEESISGLGSTLIQTELLRSKFPELLKTYSINSVFDSPCGDLNWMSLLIASNSFDYIGGDIVKEIVSNNTEKFGNSKTKFMHFDITKDQFPNADMWLCRHVLFHLSNKDIYLALENYANSNVKYILTTNCKTASNHINQDIVTGNYRGLNLKLSPFNFPDKAIWEIDDYVDPAPPMTIALWRIEDIRTILPEIKKNLGL
jgi:hypothetical protein